MIDVSNGNVKIGSLVLSSKFGIEDFVSTEFEHDLFGQQRDQGKWAILYLKQPVVLNGMMFTVTFTFKEKKLVYFDLMSADPNLQNSYEDWSKEKLEMTKKVHDEWLENTLGNPPYEYDWGKIRSYIDVRSGSASIIIEYK